MATLLLTAGAASADVLPEYMWEKRPIVVIGAEDDPRVARQMALFEAETAELAERRNIVLRRMPDGPLAEALGAETFGVFLIGLDGGVKFRSSDVTPPDDLHALVDAMPMRREELRRRSP
ncbi:MAG: DUF4174 domain-containing protein [Pseudomonadota bacterium]